MTRLADRPRAAARQRSPSDLYGPTVDFEVRRDDLHETRVVDPPPAACADGEARLVVRRFGFSANNITYAVFGDMMGYWTFFPAADGWGRIPVWGFAEVVEANDTGLEVGDLFYGYLPMSNELVVSPERVTAHGFHDGAPHRAALPPAYNGYTRCATDPVYSAETEALQMLFRPLFMTDFLLDDWLADNDFHGAAPSAGGVLVLSSASSKTAFGLAHLLAARSERPEIIGLTSIDKMAFVEGLDVYDRVLGYGDTDGLAADAPTVYIDMAGDTRVRRDVHERVSGLVASVSVGGTHWREVGGAGDLPGPQPVLFFAPDQIVRRRADWGQGGLESRFGSAWSAFVPVVEGWISVVERNGIDGVEQTYREVLDGEADPSDAFVLDIA